MKFHEQGKTDLIVNSLPTSIGSLYFAFPQSVSWTGATTVGYGTFSLSWTAHTEKELPKKSVEVQNPDHPYALLSLLQKCKSCSKAPDVDESAYWPKATLSEKLGQWAKGDAEYKSDRPTLKYKCISAASLPINVRAYLKAVTLAAQSERLRSYIAGASFGLWAAAMALAPTLTIKAVLVAPALLLPIAWWTVQRPGRWIALFLGTALLLPPLPIAIGDSGPHPCLWFAAIGLFAGVLWLPDWRIEGLRTKIGECGRVSATRKASAAAIVDLPTCREQSSSMRDGAGDVVPIQSPIE